jgi:hypothetical protein
VSNDRDDRDDEIVFAEELTPSRPPAGSYSLQTLDGPIEGMTNLDLTTNRGKALFLAAGNPGSIQFDEHGRMCILATHFVIFPDTSVDPETGEEREFTRTVLFDASGQTYRTSSAYAPRRLRAALALWTASDWASGIPFVITERKSRKTGRTYHDMRVEY